MSSLILLNKPFDVLCQFTDSQGRSTLKDYVEQPGVYPAGRLDRDSEGLVILTGDGALNHKITDPEHKMSKTYWVQVEGVPKESTLAQFKRGIELKDGVTRPSRCRLMAAPAGLWPRTPPIRYRKHVPDSWLEITLSEGRNRQVRRMCATAGFPVLRLIRYRIGSWTLDGIPPGQWRRLELKRSAK